jgi:hypothetical protein
VSEKAFNIIFKNMGYIEATGADLSALNSGPNAIGYEDITIKEIKNKLEEKGVEYNKSANKKELFELLLGSD